MSLLKLNQYVLKVLSFILLLACAVQFISFGKATLTVWNLYTFALIALPALYILFNQEQDEFNSEPNFTNKDYLIIGLFFGVQMGMRIYGLERFSLWFDETAQLARSMDIPFIESSGLHFQPPLDYILQKFTAATFGFSDFKIRLNTAVFSVVASTLFFALLKRITGSYIVALLLSCLMIFEPWFFKYSFDARPVAIGYLTLVLFVVSFINVLKPQSNSLKKSEFRQLLAVALFFNLSVGFQPVLLLCTLIAVLLVRILMAFKNKEHKNYYLSLIYPLALSILLFIPVQIKIYLDSIHLVTSNRVLSKVTNFNINNISGLYDVYSVYFALLFVLLLTMILLRQLKKKLKITTFESNFFVAVCLMFFLASLFVFSVLLSYRLAPHYVIFTLPLIFLAAAYLYKTCEDCFSITLQKRFFRMAFVFLIVLALPLFGLMYAQHPKKPMAREDLKQAYAIILKNSTDKDYVTSLSFPLNNWSPIELNLAGWPYYVNRAMREGFKSYADISRNKEIPILSLYTALKENPKISNLYVIFNRGFEQVNVQFDVLKELPNVELTYLENVLLLRVQNDSGDLKKEWFNVIDILAEKTEVRKSWVFQVLLAEKFLLTKQKENFAKTLQEIREMSQQNDNRTIMNRIISALENEGDNVFM